MARWTVMTGFLKRGGDLSLIFQFLLEIDEIIRSYVTSKIFKNIFGG